MAVTNLRPIVEGANGVTLLSLGLVLIREDWEFLESYLKKVSDAKTVRTGSKRELELALTLNHEHVHFIQGFTTTFAYSYSLALRKLCSEMMARSRAGMLGSSDLNAYRKTYATYQHQLTKRTRGVSAVDLLEAVAVTESFRSTTTHINPASFVSYLDAFFPNDTVYRRVIDIISNTFLVDAALNLAPRLCFLALNGDDPGTNFWEFVDRLIYRSPINLSTVSAWDLCTFFGMDPEASLLKQFDSLPPDKVHKTFRPYQEYLISLDSFKRIFEFVARPGDWSAIQAPDARALMLSPPLVLCSGGRATVQGLARSWTKDQAFQYIDAAALVGVCERLLTDEKPFVKVKDFSHQFGKDISQ